MLQFGCIDKDCNSDVHIVNLNIETRHTNITFQHKIQTQHTIPAPRTQQGAGGGGG